MSGFRSKSMNSFIFVASLFVFLATSVEPLEFNDSALWAQTKKEKPSPQKKSKNTSEKSKKKKRTRTEKASKTKGGEKASSGQSNEAQGNAPSTQTEDAQESEESQTAESQDPDKEVIEVESGNLYDILQEGGVLMLPLILLFLIGLTLVIERTISFTRNKFWSTKVFEESLKIKVDSLPSEIYKETLEEELQKESQKHIAKLDRGLDLLNGVGNLSPLMGFLGTVVGMINAFAAIASTANVNAKVVASGIKEALVTTAGGLIIAVPVLAAYYIFIHFVNRANTRIDDVIQDICSDKKSITQ